MVENKSICCSLLMADIARDSDDDDDDDDIGRNVVLVMEVRRS